MKRKILTTAICFVMASPAIAQDVFLDNATIFDLNGEQSISDVQISDGVIAAIAPDLTAIEGSDILSDVWVSPGLVASVSTLGIVDIGGESDTNDTTSNTDLASVAIRAADSFNPREVHIANARRRGVSYAVILPYPSGDRIFGGIGMVASLDGHVLREDAAVHIALGEAGARRAGGSRSAAMTQLRGAFQDVQRGFLTQDEGNVLRRVDARALRPVLAGRMPLMISASRASDLSNIIDLKSDYPALDIIIIGAEEAHLVADDLAAADIKLIVDPLENLPDSFDTVNASFDNIVAIDAAGVDYAISGLSSFRTVKAGSLNQHAGNAIGHGLTESAAIRAVTSTPARWFGIDIGNMSVGSPANVTIWDGHPLEAMSAPVAMYRDGVSLSLESRMTALRDRYNPSSQDNRPYSYR